MHLSVFPQNADHSYILDSPANLRAFPGKLRILDPETQEILERVYWSLWDQE